MTTLWPEQRLQEVEARLKAATPGPWVTAGPPYVNWSVVNGPAWTGHRDNLKDYDATFIAHARTDLADAVAEIRRLQKELRQATHCRGCHAHVDDSPICDDCRG